MKWPYSERVAPGTAWAVVGVGVALLAAVTGIFATIHGTQPNYRWWWPTAWMWAPGGVTAAGLCALVVPLRRGSDGQYTEVPRSQVMVDNEMSGHAGNVVQAGQVTGNIFQGPVTMAAATLAGRSERRTVREPIGIGEGIAGAKGPFQRAYNELWGRTVMGTDGTSHLISILDPSSEVDLAGPGMVQYFDSLHSEFGWVMCVRPGQRVVVISGEIWNELLAIGAQAPFEHPLDGLGYPASLVNGTACIDDSALEIHLAGGKWGPGLLLRATTDEPWRWEPEPTFDINRTRDADNWAREMGMRLRLRVVATLPWQVSNDLEITPPNRDALIRELATSELLRYGEDLLRRRGFDFSVTAWDEVENSNTSDRLGYECILSAPDGRRIVTIEALMHLPGAISSSVVTCVQVSVHDLDISRDVEAAASGARLSTEEVAEFYSIAAVAATTLLPTVLGNQLPITYLSPPKIQIVLAVDKEDYTKPMPYLAQYVALDVLGQNGRGPTDRLEVAVTTAPLSDTVLAGRLMRDALAFAARKFGFSNATAENFE